MESTEDTLLQLLKQRRVLVSDGATGTNLQARGLSAGETPEDWVLDEPDKVLGLHREFVAAGSDLILTCSFGGNPIRFGRSRHAERVDEMNVTAAELARRATEGATRPVLVGGSLGPTGEMMEPYGTLTEDSVREAFARQAGSLAKGGVDFLALETFFSLEEATAALEGLRSASDLPVVLTFSYDRGLKTMMGVSPSRMVAAFRDVGLSLLGANCGTTLENMEAIVAEIAAADPGMPVWAKPNAGVPSGTPPEFPVNPDEMGRFAGRLIEAGASVVGGCCGSTPAHVQAIAQVARLT